MKHYQRLMVRNIQLAHPLYVRELKATIKRDVQRLQNKILKRAEKGISRPKKTAKSESLQVITCIQKCAEVDWTKTLPKKKSLQVQIDFEDQAKTHSGINSSSYSEIEEESQEYEMTPQKNFPSKRLSLPVLKDTDSTGKISNSSEVSGYKRWKISVEAEIRLRPRKINLHSYSVRLRKRDRKGQVFPSAL